MFCKYIYMALTGCIPVIVLSVHKTDKLIEAPRGRQHIRSIVSEIPLSDGVVLVAYEVSEHLG